MQQISVLAGGKTGYGIDSAGLIISRLFSRLGYQVYMNNDYPSQIRGGHQFVIVRAATHKIAAHSDQVDVVLAFNQDALDLHQSSLKDNTLVIYDSAKVQVDGLPQSAFQGLDVGGILKAENGSPDMDRYCMIGGLCRALNIDLGLLEELLRKHDAKLWEQKMKVARQGYARTQQVTTLEQLLQPVLPVLNGCQAIGLGLLKAGLQAYVAYPMTPVSPILELFACLEPEFELQVVLPESEIAVMLMATGYAYMGVKNAVGTSGGGFSLMVEGLSLAGQAELPVVVVLGQRSGPSTGMPTYTAQADLGFVLTAGHGEFPRLIVAPGDAEEAYYWSGVALNKAWQYQLPAFILADKTLCLNHYSFDIKQAPELHEEQPVLWDGKDQYRRYRQTDNGISPLAFPPLAGQVVKTNSYVHDEFGIISEEPAVAKAATDKGLLKERYLAEELQAWETVKVYHEGVCALLCWGSNKGVCLEIAQQLGLKLIQLVVLAPFPTQALRDALQGVEQLISVEGNAKGQLAILLQQHGFQVDKQIHKYDGRPFSLEDLANAVWEALK
ncbi:2-oxoglutarate oxidoreductase subunit KorA [Sporotomaculum syntrophicum]|uniref:2-oxoglutarate oxidoreductase subunit KorA n=1 Tax=Sporotomaculum syntrophicum TaxID=182264 RepID=A0A9D2WM73_9FIRM|nr:2-oxoacid:acceptor oxidoreductase subunit alpha [Sporotomaculum syntrophicum]KAF1083749.1 2-oxoglutarate oxidoreductase subunit KorA [Sporotomaculum syntrophicum]